MTYNVPDSTSTQPNTAPRLTVLGLFEDIIDANRALSDLRNDPVPPEAVSLVVRENAVADGDGNPRASDVVTALSDAALKQAGEWMVHLVSLILPRDGAFLVAGPIGAILAGSESVTRRDKTDSSIQTGHARDDARPLLAALVRFGYGEEEANYLALRVIAGSVLIGLTTADSKKAGDARRIFADRGAVHIGTNWTEFETATHADTLLHAPVEAARDEQVVVFDSVPFLVGLCHHENPGIAATCGGEPVVDRHGNEIGLIEDLLAEIENDRSEGSNTVHIRYVVVGFGGLLGMGRSFVAVPAVHVSLDTVPIRLNIDHVTLHAAPLYNANRPFSRREEELVCDHFGCPLYWLSANDKIP